MKKKIPAFLPLGRLPKRGEWARWVRDDERADDCYFICSWDTTNATGRQPEAVERREVEIEVEDPVPEWIAATKATLAAAFDAHNTYPDELDGWVEGDGLDYICGVMDAAYRAHVEAKAKAAMARIVAGYSLALRSDRDAVFTMIRECFLEDR